MYIQPYDQIDRTCNLPLNQSIIYDKYTLSEYMNKLIEDNKLFESTYEVKTDWYEDNYYEGIGFNDYCSIIRRKAARIIWSEKNIPNFDKNKWTDYDIIEYIDENNLKDNFNEFYQYQASFYKGFVQR